MNARRFRLQTYGRVAGTLLSFALLLVLQSPSFALPPAVGTKAPSFTLASLDAPHFSLAGTQGHVVVVNFFATWCPPCRAETPALVAAHKRYSNHGVIFIGVDDREEATLVSVFAKSKGIIYPIVLDNDGSVSRQYDVRAIPTTYVLDRKGTIRWAQVDELNPAVLSSAIDAVLAGQPVPESVAARTFSTTAATAQAQIESDLKAARSQTPPVPAPLDTAVATGTAANKKLDEQLAKPDASSINYFALTRTRGELNTALADAYELRSSIPGSKTAMSDQTEAALLRGQVALDAERYSDAAAQFDVAMRLSPKDTRGYDGAYMAAYEVKDNVKAAQIADAEAALVPDDPESWLAVSSAQNALKNYPKALTAQRKALALASEAYAKNPNDKKNAYELGRVWLKMARTQLLAGNAGAAQPLLLQAQAAAPDTIVAQQASEQYLALTSAVAIESTQVTSARGQSAQPAKVYVVVRNPSSQSRTINLSATGLPPKWLLSFCYSTVCNPYKVSFALAAGGTKRIELLVAPLAQTGGPWSMEVKARGAATAHVRVQAKTANAAILITAS